MKNVTVALPDDVYRRARMKAAENDTSLSALVRTFLLGLGGETSDFDRRKRLQAEVLRGIRRFRGADRLSRADVHRRDALR